MPFVLHGKEGHVTISSCGIRHDISVRVDSIRQQPLIDRRERVARLVKNGTIVTLHWPDSAFAQSLPAPRGISYNWRTTSPSSTRT
jgi:hypothetical protein